MDEQFIRDRITQLRVARGVSKYQMSYDLGHSRGYIYNISSGKSLPPLREFLGICEYFGVTPTELEDYYQISQQGISRRLKKVLKKLARLMKT